MQKKQVAALEAAADNETYGIQLQQQAAHVFVDSPKEVDEVHLAAEDNSSVTWDVESSGTKDEQNQDPTMLAIGSTLEYEGAPETWDQRQERLLRVRRADAPTTRV